MGLYSHYDGAHTHPVNRALHMIAIPVGFSSRGRVVPLDHWTNANPDRFRPGLAGSFD